MTERLIAYASRSTERKYSQVEKEGLALWKSSTSICMDRSLLWLKILNLCQLYLDQKEHSISGRTWPNIATVTMSAANCRSGVLPTILSLSSSSKQFTSSLSSLPFGLRFINHLISVNLIVMPIDVHCNHSFTYFAIDFTICHLFLTCVTQHLFLTCVSFISHVCVLLYWEWFYSGYWSVILSFHNYKLLAVLIPQPPCTIAYVHVIFFSCRNQADVVIDDMLGG